MRKKIILPSRLNLSSESVRLLSQQQLTAVGGATGDYCLLTPSCRFVCTKVY
jgi:hypothetical protein